MNAANQHKVLAILQAIIVDETGTEATSWQEIVKVVGAEIKVKNWLDVRGIIQYMLNNKMIARVNNVHVEAYYKLPA